MIEDRNGTQSEMLGNSTTSNYTSFNFSNGNIEISVSSGTSIGLFAHELKHAFQFEKGKYSVGPHIKNKGYSNLFYDQGDEIEAHQRGAIFDVPFSGVLSDQYNNNAKGSYDFSNIPMTSAAASSQVALQRVSKVTGHAFRINGKTYYTKK